MRWRLAGVVLVTAALLVGCGGGGEQPATQPTAGTGPGAGGSSVPGSQATVTATPSITVSSTAFVDGAAIPPVYSCRGRGISPPLAWTAPPSGAAALALVVDDPDAVGGLFIHWVVTDIPPDTRGSAEAGTPAGGRVAQNSAGVRGYLGPCPPTGTGVHHYRFTVYALSEPLQLADTTPAAQAVDAIARKATTQGRLVGTFTG